MPHQCSPFTLYLHPSELAAEGMFSRMALRGYEGTPPFNRGLSQEGGSLVWFQIKRTEVVGAVGQIVWAGDFLSFSSQPSRPPPRQGSLPEPPEAGALESRIELGNWGDIGTGVLKCLHF